LRAFFLSEVLMSQGKIVPLIAAAEQRAVAQADADIKALIQAIDEQVAELERQLDRKIEQLAQRVSKLEQGGATPEASA
jgi:uncharacterized protein YceH (UPF0502 family)